jgi:hypothetical protein
VRRRRTIFVLVFVVMCWVLACGVVLALAARQAVGAQHRVTAVRHQLATGKWDEASARDQLTDAGSRFTRAERLSRSPVLAPARFVPLVGRQLRSFEALAAAGRRVTTIVDRAASDLPSVAAHTSAGEDRIALARRIGRVSTEVAPELARIDLGPRTWLIPPLASRRRAFQNDLGRLRRAVDIGTELGPLLTGPKHYLFLAANNAEMRAGSGMFLEAGELTIADGHLTLGAMEPTYALHLPTGDVPMDPDVRRNWGWIHPNEEWRNVNVTPRFDVSARMAAAMWRSLGRGTVDGVIAIDPVGLAEVLKATGPVDVDGSSIRSDNVTRELLHDQYVGLAPTDDANAARRERLGRIAAAALGALEDRPIGERELATALSRAAAGRHVLAWSSAPREEAMWEAARMDGRFPDDGLMVSVLNRNGTKLDRYLTVDATITPGTLRIHLRNDVPAGEPSYIAGPHPLSHSVAGEYEGILLVTLPRGSTASVVGHRRLAVGGQDGPSTVVGLTVDLKRGATQDVTVRFAGPRTAVVVPSARSPAIRWHLGRVSWTDGLRKHVSW